MRTVEVEFLEDYKSLDNILKDAYHSETGVSTYIETMEGCADEGSEHVKGWKDDYYLLKRLRWLRNVISHEAGNSECEDEDLDRLKDFKERVLSGEDPLVLLHKKKQSQKKQNYKHRETVYIQPAYNSHDTFNGPVILLAILITIAIIMVLLISKGIIQ